MVKLNQIIISGRLVADPELRTTAKGTAVIRFTLAVDRSIKQADGTYDNQVSFIDFVAWQKTAEYLNNYGFKGCGVVVSGHIEARNYIDTNNVNKKAVEIIAENLQLLDKKQIEPKAEPEPETQEVQATFDDVPF